MLEGKAYTKTLRACLLCDAALHIVLLNTDEDTSSTSHDGEFSEVTENMDYDDVPILDSHPTLAADHHESVNPVTDDMWPELRDLYDSVYVQQDMTPESAAASQALRQLHTHVCELKEKQEQTRTGKLWVMFMKFITISMMFIRAERTGNWSLHLKASQEMLPYFAAAGHNNYTKYCRLYLQDSQNLCECLKQPMEDGKFTVRRNEKLFWSGIWSDMTIEQCLMRAGKTQGGLINITHKESARTKWLLSAHVLAQYNEAIRSLTSTFTGTWSEQHRDVQPGSIKQDMKDLQTFVHFLQDHNPFSVEDDTQLKNVATDLNC